MVDVSSPATLSQFYSPIANERSREGSLANAMKAVQSQQSIQQNQQSAIDAQQDKFGLAMLYKNIAPQKDESGKVQKSEFIDETGRIDWGKYLNSPAGAEWATKYPHVASVLMDKAGLLGGGKATMGNKFTEFIEQMHPEAAGGNPAQLIRTYGPEYKSWTIDQKIATGSVGALTEVLNDPVATSEQKKTAQATLDEQRKQAAAKSEENANTPERVWEKNRTDKYVKRGMNLADAQSKAIEDYNKTVKPSSIINAFVGKEDFNLAQLVQTFENPRGSYKNGDKEGRFTTAGIMSFSEALAKGQTIDEFANSQSSSRGVMGTEGKNYLKGAYSDYLAATVKDKDGKPMNPAKIGAYLSARGNAFKVNLQTQKKAGEFSMLNNRAVAQMDNMAKILETQEDALTTSGAKPRALLNAWIKGAWNDPKYGSFLVALNSYLSEYMKVVSGGALSVQAITDSARSTGKELLSKSDNMDTLQAKLDIMHQEVDGVKQTWDNAVETTYGAGAITDIGTAPPTAAPEKDNAPKTTIPADHKWQ